MKGRILVLAAALVILSDPSRVSDAAPPSGFPWKMTFNDEFFSRQDLDLQKWSVRCRSSLDRSEAEVLRDNVEIEGGVCRLRARKGDDGERWTNANMFSRTFQQRYGYFEARIKTSATEGFTNVFALISRKHFFIDVVHAVPPQPHITRARAFGGQGYPDESHGKALGPGKDFHLYGLLWTDSEVAWYVDGRQVRRVSHTALRQPARVQLVTWGNGLDGTVSEPMVVDYVRVYERLQQPPKWSDRHDGVQ